MSKPKGKLDSLDDQDFQKLKGWLLGGMTYSKAVQVVNMELGIQTSRRALQEFWDEYCAPEFLERRRGAARLSSTLRKEMQASPEDFDSATVDLLSRLSFELADRAGTADPKLQKRTVRDVKTLFMLVLKRRDQDLKNKQVDISLRKLERLEKQDVQAREALGDTKLTPQQRDVRMKEIFGL